MFNSTNFTVTSKLIIDINRITLSSQRTNRVTHTCTYTHAHNFTIQQKTVITKQYSLLTSYEPASQNNRCIKLTTAGE